ncbi:hypothetical protein [Methylococcus sp. EFPC2]|uniref:hypothetical protein n=1 Tax=Methylococcus sp. EFPC2 TaxID=2812648 RepID=UPI0019673950|nr:hypothetical protein [Methylococcus sp. EFPC2]QSA96225.1 hypothetical protein JWZ97_13440 [Methylococcus sp. EFPC2]
MSRVTIEENQIDDSFPTADFVNLASEALKGDDMVVEHLYDPGILEQWSELAVIEEIEIKEISPEASRR